MPSVLSLLAFSPPERITMSKKKKNQGWRHPKTGVKWPSKRAYHKYWEKHIKPQSNKKNSKKEETPEPELTEDDPIYDPDWFYLNYIRSNNDD
jgi:hypothetical protein